MEQLNKNEEIKLVNEPIKKLILTLAIPAILGQVLDIAYNIIDGIFIGQWVGEQGLAGIGLTLPITLVNMAISIMLGVGTSTAIGRYIGENNKEKSIKVLSLGLFYTIAINGMLSIIMFFFGNNILALMGADQTLNSYAMSYLAVVSVGFIFMGVAMLLCDVLRNEGIIAPSIVVMMIGLVGNIIFDVVFMYFIPLGMLGAGIATLTAQGIGVIYLILYYIKNPVFKISFKKIEFGYSKEIFSVGTGVFSREIVEAIVLILYNTIILNIGGVTYLAAFSIINKIIMVVYMPVGGFAEGLQPIISVNYGAKKLDRIKDAMKISIIYSSIYVIVAATISCLLANNLIGLFGGTNELLNITKNGLFIMIIGMVFIPVTIMGAVLFQGINKPKESVVVNLSRQLIFLVPVLLVLPNIFGINGVYYATVISEILSATLTIYLCINYFSKKNILKTC